MSKRDLLPPALGVLLLGLVLGLWFFVRSDGTGEPVELALVAPLPLEPLTERTTLQVGGERRDDIPDTSLAVPGGISIAAGVRVPGSGWVEGRVLDRESGAVLEGMRVELFAVPPAGAPFIGELASLVGEVREYVGTGEALATTGSDILGSFRFEGVHAGTWYVQARGARHVPDTYARVRVSSSGDGGPVDVFVRSGGRVVGVVLRPDGRPAPGAEVTLLPSITTILDSVRTGSLCFLQTESEEDGSFVIPGVPPGLAYDIYAEGRGFALSFVLDVAVRAGEDSEVVLQTRKGGRVTGRVVSVGDPEHVNAPVAGAHVAAVPHGLRYIPFAPGVLLATRTVTDSEGNYSLDDVPPGEIDVVGIAAGHAACVGPTVYVPEGTGANAEDFELEVGPTVSGRVVDAAGEPIAGVRVIWDPVGLNRAGFQGSIAPLVARVVRGVDFPTTGADGRFEAGAFPGDGPYELNFEKEGYAKLQHFWDPGSEQELEIVLLSGGFIEGIVIDAEQAQPLATFTVESDSLVGSKALPFSGPFGGNLVETDRGRFRIGPFRPGAVRIEVDADGYLKSTVSELEVGAGETLRGVIVKLFPGGVVRGRVVDENGARIAGAIVFPRYESPGDSELPADWEADRGEVDASDDRVPRGLSSYVAQLGVMATGSSITGPDGRFELSGMEPGLQTVGAVQRNYSPGWSEPFSIVYGGEAIETEVVLNRGGAIFGKVVDRFDRPIEHATVVAVAPYNMESDTAQGDALYQGSTDEEGSYRIDHVAAGTYFMVLTRGDEALDPMSFLGAMNFDMVTLATGEEIEHDIVDQSVGGTRLFGRVIARNEVIESGQITAMGFESDSILGVDIKATRIREGGRYEFKGLAPGEYQFQIRSSDFGGEGRLLIDVPDVSEVQMDLALPNGRIAGRVLDDATGEPIASAWVSAASNMTIQPEGFLSQMFGRESGLLHDRTDKEGNFTFEYLQAADYDLTVRSAKGKQGLIYAPGEPLALSLDDDQEIGGVELRLQPALQLEVTVFDSEGQPVEGANVTAWIEGRLDTLKRSGATGADGRCKVSGLAPGEYTLRASREDFASTRITGVKLSREHSVEEEITLDGGIAVSVEIFGSNGRPVSGATARLQRADGEADPGDAQEAFQSLFQGEGVSDSRGHLELGRFLPGSYTLEAQRGSARSQPERVSLEAGTDGVTLRTRLR